MFLDFSLKKEYNYRIAGVIKKTDKLSDLLNDTSMVTLKKLNFRMWVLYFRILQFQKETLKLRNNGNVKLGRYCEIVSFLLFVIFHGVQC